MSKDYDFLPTTSETWIYLSMIRLMLKRLVHECIRPAFHYRHTAVNPRRTPICTASRVTRVHLVHWLDVPGAGARRGPVVTALRITIGSLIFVGQLEEDAPKTCAAFTRLPPFHNKIIQARWSGESAWFPLGDFDVGVGFENHTSHPAPGQVLIYPGGYSEIEILFPYGATCSS